MRRRKDNKRVLKSGNGRQNASKGFLRPGNGRQNTLKSKIGRNRNNNFNRPVMSNNAHNQYNHKKRKTSGTLILVLVLALIAFVIGAGIGVSLSFDDGSDEGPHYENVTEEMTKNVNITKEVSYDKDVDNVDFNENATSQLNVQHEQVEEVEDVDEL